MGRLGISVYSNLLITLLAAFTFSVAAEDRCKDESFCRAYCLSTNPDTMGARCGRDMQSCICFMPNQPPVKVRFIEERNPVPPTTPSTTQTPLVNNGLQTVNSQPISHYNGNGNSIAQQAQQQPQNQPGQMVPVLLECDASETSTRMCHSFCTIEIRAWYGLCNVTSRACACFGIPLSAVQQEPIAAIFHSTAPMTPPPPTAPNTQKPLSPAHPGFQQFPHPYPQSPSQLQQQWRPIQPSSPHSSQHYQLPQNNFKYSPPPPAHQNNQLQEPGPVRSAASLFGSNGQPLSSGINTPAVDAHSAGIPAPTSAFAPSVVFSNDTVDEVKQPSSEEQEHPEAATTTMSPVRKRRSINDTPLKKNKESPTLKESQGQCSKFKCAIACKRNNYLAPDCEPKCIGGECWCECFPRL